MLGGGRTTGREGTEGTDVSVSGGKPVAGGRAGTCGHVALPAGRCGRHGGGCGRRRGGSGGDRLRGRGGRGCRGCRRGRGGRRRTGAPGDQGCEIGTGDLAGSAGTAVDLEGVDECRADLGGGPPRGNAATVVPTEVDLGDVDPHRAGRHRVEGHLELVGPVLADHRGHRGPPAAGSIDRDRVIAHSRGRAPHRLGVDDHPVDGGRGGQGDGEARGGIAGARAPTLAVSDRESVNGRRGVPRGCGGGGSVGRCGQIGPVPLCRPDGQGVAHRVGDIGDLVADGKAVGGAGGDRHRSRLPVLGGDGDRDAAATGCAHRDRAFGGEAVRPHCGEQGAAGSRRTEIGPDGLGDAGRRHGQVGPVTDLVGGGHGGQGRRFHVVVGGGRLDQRERDAVVAPGPFVVVVAPHRDVQRLLPDHRP